MVLAVESKLCYLAKHLVKKFVLNSTILSQKGARHLFGEMENSCDFVGSTLQTLT